MQNKYYYLGDCKAIPEEFKGTSLPTLEVDPTFAATLAVGWFEGKERYEMLVDTKWEDCLRTSYESYKKHWPDLYRTIIVQPPPVEVDQDIEKHIGQTIYEINQRNSKVIGYLSTTPPQPSSYEISIEEKAKMYAERVCSGNFPIEYSREQVVKHTANDFMAGIKFANPIGFSRFLYYGTWQTIGDNGEDMLYKSYKTGEEKFASELYNLFLDNMDKYNPAKYSDELKDVLKDLTMGFYNQMGSAWCQKIVDKITKL